MQDASFSNAIELLEQGADIYRYNVAYPELVAPIISSVIKFSKDTKVAKWRAVCKGLTEALGRKSAWVQQRRSSLGEGPSQMSSLETFRPSSVPRAAERMTAQIEAKAAKRAALLASDGPHPSIAAQRAAGTLKRKRNDRRKGNGAEPDTTPPKPDAVVTSVSGQSSAKKSRINKVVAKGSTPRGSGKESAAAGGNDTGEDRVTEGFDWDSDED